MDKMLIKHDDNNNPVAYVRRKGVLKKAAVYENGQFVFDSYNKLMLLSTYRNFVSKNVMSPLVGLPPPKTDMQIFEEGYSSYFYNNPYKDSYAVIWEDGYHKKLSDLATDTYDKQHELWLDHIIKYDSSIIPNAFARFVGLFDRPIPEEEFLDAPELYILCDHFINYIKYKLTDDVYDNIIDVIEKSSSFSKTEKQTLISRWRNNGIFEAKQTHILHFMIKFGI